jgi:(2Fe-2S) ferredoxin
MIAVHLFVCQNERPSAGRPSCAARGGAQVLAALQRAVAADPTLGAEVAVTPCGCLGPCYDGPMVVVYPDGVWYRGVAPEDVPEIVDSHLRQRRPVERLRFRWDQED